MDAYTKATGAPNIKLIGERILKTNPGKVRGKDFKMKICKLIDFELLQVRYVLKIIPSYLINKSETKPIILDTGCYRSATGFIYEFVEGTLVQLWYPHLMGSIFSSLESTHKVTLHYGVINNEGEFSVLEVTGIFMPELKWILLSPQDYLMDIQILYKSELSLTVTW